MNRNAFRDALIAALWLGGDLDVPGHCELVADIVLAMPEIQTLLANEAEIERLRTAGDRLSAAVNAVTCSGPRDEMAELTDAFLDWEAPRG